MTKEQKSALFRHLFKLIFSVPHKSLLPKEARATIADKQTITFKLVPGTALRGYESRINDQHIIIMEQNPAGYSKGALLAKWKYNCAWIWIQKKPYPRLERSWLAFMIRRANGEVGIFSGKHIMTRVFAVMRNEINQAREAIMRPDENR